jgi:hypothetical protein
MKWRILPPNQVKLETDNSPLESTLPVTSIWSTIFLQGPRHVHGHRRRRHHLTLNFQHIIVQNMMLRTLDPHIHTVNNIEALY